MMSKELNILLNAVRFDVQGQTEFDQSNLSDSKKIDFQMLLRLAHYHGLVWQLTKFCKANKLLFTDDQVSMVRQLTMHETAHSMSADSQLLRLIEKLEGQDIDYAVLKGTAITAQFRRCNETKSRSSADIDLLVKTDQIDQALTVLAEMGYSPNDAHVSLKTAKFMSQHAKWVMRRDLNLSHGEHGKIDVDLHWRVTYPFSLPLDTEDIFSRLEQIRIEGKKANTLSFEDHFLLLCVHGYLDKFFLLKYLADIFYAMNHPRFDVEKMLLHAEKYGVGQHIKESCETASCFFSGHVVHSIENQSAYVKDVVTRFELQNSIPSRLFPAKPKWSLQDKLRYIAHQITTRSNQSYWWEPVLLRMKYDFKMIEQKPDNIPVFMWWPIGIVKKLFRQS